MLFNSEKSVTIDNAAKRVNRFWLTLRLSTLKKKNNWKLVCRFWGHAAIDGEKMNYITGLFLHSNLYLINL